MNAFKCILFATGPVWKMNIESPNDPAMLTCWKDIARYMGKGVRTVQRWEQEFGLPVRRPNGAEHKSTVIANSRDLDKWLGSRWSLRANHGDRRTKMPQMAEGIDPVRGLREAHHNLIIEAQEATNEELQSANEEIQSGNEELQSTNEELQTSKEEMELANEELHTVNEEIQHRNELLTQLNNDLTNLLNSVNLPIVMVGADLSVRRFTPQASTVLGLMASDIGRPIPRLKLKIDVSNLEQMMLDVIQEVQAKQHEVQDQEGKWCSLRITPYRTLDNQIDGVVLTVVDTRVLDDGDGAKTSKSAKTSPARPNAAAKMPLKK